MRESFLTEVENPLDYNFEGVTCYGCGADDYRFFLSGEDDLTGKDGCFQFVQCNNCQLVYQQPRLELEQIKSFYDDEYILHRKENNWGVFNPLVKWTLNKHDRVKDRLIRKHLSLNSNSEVLDVGCGVGTFLLYLNSKYNCKMSGVDFKEIAGYPGFNKIEFFLGLFYDQNITINRFDMITMWHFLEHCYNPNKSLQMARKVLKDGGKLIIEVPRLDSFTYKLFGNKWPGIQAPQHTALYSKKAFTEILDKNGFRIIEYLPYGAFPPFFYIFAGLYFRLFGKGLKLKRVLFFYIIGEILLSPVLLLHKYLNLSMHTIICEKKANRFNELIN